MVCIFAAIHTIWYTYTGPAPFFCKKEIEKLFIDLVDGENDSGKSCHKFHENPDVESHCKSKLFARSP